ncbi:MAG: BrnT family toxin [Bdellovibrionota bacterium]|nr:MAG: BrnT family toxin [Bdellovibrionota bacterium]
MFTWDVKKALANFEKHAISFEEAATAFADTDGLDGVDQKHSQLEPRHFRVARSAEGKVLTIIYTVRRTSDGKETIRIISARKASRKERAAYQRR